MSSSTAAKTMWETATFGQVLVNVIKKEWPWVTGFATVGAVQAYMHLNLTEEQKKASKYLNPYQH
eukprot:CAMPEP_0119195024 /NCGR_PEP_ID=MMETSP1316-20130426/4652_1 /TAXON_ID=41880 /ORGANISM="Pycnococcus provasolii, Strain RCC2336" /LENGTH=64 /DNA_ID=CAMNT_0007190393 /DNA_START=38 /DNA_END=232 /DNA_ORIENTATION=+